MKSDKLIDKIREIETIVKDTDGKHDYDKHNLKQVLRICEDVLIDWKIEGKKRYTAKDAVNEVENIAYYTGKDMYEVSLGDLEDIFNQLENGVKNDE